MKKALILVDLQYDFCAGGALEVPDGDAVVPLANALMQASFFDCVVATQDWHPANHGSFAAMYPFRRPGQFIELDGLTQVLWPIHCVQHSLGAQFVADLDQTRIDKVFQKGMDKNVDSYSGFFDNGKRHDTGLSAWLRAQEVTQVYVMGLAADYCVKYTALDAVQEGFETFLIEDATRGVNLQPEDTQKAFEEMQAKGVQRIHTTDLM